MTLYYIFFCERCDLKAEISVEGDCWCSCGLSMSLIGEMNAR